MRGVSQPPESAPPPSGGPPPPPTRGLIAELEAPSGGFKRLLGRKGPMRLSLTAAEIVVEHAQYLQAPLRFAPGAVTVAVLDPGPAQVRDGRNGRFPILHQLSTGRVIPVEEGIEGWLWTSSGGTAMASITGDDAPNLAFLFTPPLGGAAVTAAFEPEALAELAKRSPLGEPALFGLLLRVAAVAPVQQELERLSLVGVVTDREIPPTQRRRLPTDKQANPAISGVRSAGDDASKPPPGFG
jgi:hypothetical protein